MQPGGSFKVYCDFGGNNLCTNVDTHGGGICAPAPINAQNPGGLFNCTAGPLGTYQIDCLALGDGNPFAGGCAGGYCGAATGPLGTLIVGNACTTPSFTPNIPPTIPSNTLFDVACDFGSNLAAANGCISVNVSGAGTFLSSTVSGSVITFHYQATGAPGPYPINCFAQGADTCAAGQLCNSLSGPDGVLYITNDPCGATGAVCGYVTSVENNSLLPGIVVELRDSKGLLLSTQRTGSAGSTLGYYSFSPATAGANKIFFVDLAIGRTETASPASAQVDTVGAHLSAKKDFLLRGLRTTVSFTNSPPASLILVTTFTFTSPSNQPPPAFKGFNTEHYSTTVGADGTTTMKVPGGSYYYTCWVPLSSGGYSRRESQRLGQASYGTPLQSLNFYCP